jgi:hypothetical protein
MQHVTLTIDPAFTVGPVRRRTFGSFVEHLGRCVYTGIHDPAHPTADADGFRGDVVELTRELGISTIRMARAVSAASRPYSCAVLWPICQGPSSSLPRHHMRMP